MDASLLVVPTDEKGSSHRRCDSTGALDDADDVDDVFAVVATGGTTNAGFVDDLGGVADVAAQRGLVAARRRRRTGWRRWPRRERTALVRRSGAR